tara:strand:- start:172 stop:954 length:783 start_codon:yes stop_codon:yes gene_type:complete
MSTGEVTTLATGFNKPSGVTVAGTNLYVADTNNHTIRKIVIANGTVTTLAGSSGNIGSEDGTGTSAKFNYPYGITTDGTNLYVADKSNNRIRKIVIDNGTVTTLAGSSSGFLDGTGTEAKFNTPKGITTDGANLYVVDKDNNKIRKIGIDNGTVTTLAGGSGVFNSPQKITIAGSNLYVSDKSNHRIRKIVISTGAVTTLAGTGSAGSSDANGTLASFNEPYGLTSVGTSLFVADTSNHKIRKIALRETEISNLTLHKPR